MITLSNAQHLIENAISEIECGHNFEDFRAMDNNVEMSEDIGIALESIWDMAVYVMHTLKPIWESELLEVDNND